MSNISLPPSDSSEFQRGAEAVARILAYSGIDARPYLRLSKATCVEIEEALKHSRQEPK